ncbi:VWA domain-containing protein [Rhodobacteraceae bacterium F11138]|nr:VWA domain-containing protein [Rhodobacteraceae bacterium F11138]
MDTLAAFHFIRPACLLALIVLAAIWYMARPKRRVQSQLPDNIAPHLAAALQVGATRTRRLYPIDTVAAALALLTLAAAGPTWSRTPDPLTAETAPLVVALKVTESMEATDLPPSRLDRARFKILDLIAARAGARTGLIAYAGSAHQVAPLTEDPDILRPLLDGLSPAVMPRPGDDAEGALALAVDLLASAEQDGAVLFVLDDLSPDAVAALNAPEAPPMVVLLALPPDSALPQTRQLDWATVVHLTPDDRDIHQIERRLRAAHRAALLADERLAWKDRGIWFIWPAALLALFWFRRGWTMRWGGVGLLLLALNLPQSVRADGWRDWFLTPDQQGRLAYENMDYSRAATLFTDPMWRGQAMLKAGQYEAAAELFAGQTTAAAAFAEGVARLRNREYRAGARAFETALEREPGFPGATTNRDIAWAIVDYVETAREESDTGENSGIGADEIVFDNEDNRGAETQIEASTQDQRPLNTEQWLDSIDTDMGDFLRSRFLLDNSGDAE